MRFKDNPLIYAIAAILATWRLTSILHQEEIASPIRKAAGIVDFGDDPEYWPYPDNFIGKVFSCFWCLSVWVGLAVTVAVILFPPLIVPFALSAGAIMIKRAMEYTPNVWIEETVEEDNNDLGYIE